MDGWLDTSTDHRAPPHTSLGTTGIQQMVACGRRKSTGDAEPAAAGAASSGGGGRRRRQSVAEEEQEKVAPASDTAAAAAAKTMAEAKAKAKARGGGGKKAPSQHQQEEEPSVEQGAEVDDLFFIDREEWAPVASDGNEDDDGTSGPGLI